MRAALSMLCILLASAPADSWAGKNDIEVAVVGLHIAGQQDTAAIENTDRLAAALERAGAIDVLYPGEVRARLVGRESLVIEDAVLSAGRSGLEAGRLLYERADLDSAVPILEQSVQDLTTGLIETPSTKDLVDALILLGLSKLFTGDKDGAERSFAQAVTLDPTRELDTVNYPPKAVSSYAAVKSKIEASAPAQLSIEVPSETKLYVDGKITSERDVRLPPGPHYLLAQGPDGTRSFSSVLLHSGDRTRVTIELRRASLAVAGSSSPQRADQTAELYRSLGRHTEAQLIVLAGETPNNQVGLQLYEPRTGNFSKVLSAESDLDPAGSIVDLAPVLAQYISDEGTLRSDRVSLQTVPLDVSTNPVLASMLLDPEPIVETVTVTRRVPWFVWAGTAALAAGGASAVALMVGADDGESPPPETTDGVIILGPLP